MHLFVSFNECTELLLVLRSLNACTHPHHSARQDHVLPLQEPILDVDGKMVSEVFVPQGTAVYCNISGVNTDPAIWGPDAKEWKPERWLSPLPDSVTSAHIPGVYTNT